MKIVFYNIFGELKNAEQETLLRLEYCFKKQGHDFIVINKEGFVISDCNEHGKYIEDIDVDFLFTYNTIELAIITFPDVFSVFCHWSPIGFIANFQSLLSLKYFNTFDYFASTYEQELPERLGISENNLAFIGSSVPVDFVQKPKLQTSRKLFYVGVNFERQCDNMRYKELFTFLDKSNQIEIYGPKKVYGVSNLWAGFKNYKGEIPFDGYSILKQINNAGLCLAINSPMHNDANGVSNRTYEAAAAGALIISDDNEFVRKYFKDSVFYINKSFTEKEASDEILKILEWSNKNPQEAYEMAQKSQEIFLKELNLDFMVENFVSKTKTKISMYKNTNIQNEIIDIVCFIDSIEQLIFIQEELKKQYYQNLNLIIVTSEKILDISDIEIPYPYTIIQGNSEQKGLAFIEACKFFKGNYFMFIDAFSKMHKRHITKNLEVLKNIGELFVYSGCYLKSKFKYINLNSKPIMRDEFLSFSTVNAINWLSLEKQIFFIETIFSRAASLFKKEILNYVDHKELIYLSDNIHHYLACCSLIKAKKQGRFTYAITSGYEGENIEETNQKVFPLRKYWYSHHRSSRTYIKEMNETFFKYNFEITPNFVPNRNLSGEISYFKDLSLRNGVLDVNYDELKLLNYIKANYCARKILKILTNHKKKKYPNIEERFILYLRNHQIIRKMYLERAMKAKWI